MLIGMGEPLYMAHARATFHAQELTFPLDRLPAISGLLKDFSKYTSRTYIAGLLRGQVCENPLESRLGRYT
jgi:hypothetical protein